ncbi:hypothetical protein COEREDRAFT_85307 [Coemansia reversa NRRL 1564]|uniref:Uncharacterized protein n=1 Tax=Coemansia reversa (strain ATCC 12441 / NRRL 1564) TaxID=763665 RepID=A0A2G5BHW4_COERN|nr:hypothetical protein COEREDRAFT_85307 [Coemansia reversa NRRL 1564]|eukprot:PIA18327.1 hypothetical protein COEREDRAFT_85307 [Coemansia reversa NRRL 1564]
MKYQTDTESLCSLDTRFSVDSSDSRACLLSSPSTDSDHSTKHSGEFLVMDTEPHTGAVQDNRVDYVCRQADLEHILAHQARTHEPSMAAQRVVLSTAKRRNMQMAELAAKVTRMGRLRFTNQDCSPVRDRRANEMEGFFDKLDRLAVDKLSSGQRYMHQPRSFVL